MAWHLMTAGYVVEVDAWNWAAGENFVVRVDAALEHADVVVSLWSTAYFAPERFTTDEWTALAARRRLGLPGAQRRVGFIKK